MAFWSLLLLIASPPLCAFAYWLNRDHEDEPADRMEIVVRSAIAGVCLSVLLIFAFWLVSLWFETNALDFYIIVGVIVLPIGGWLMMFIMSLNDWGKGLLAFLTYLAVPACIALLVLRS